MMHTIWKFPVPQADEFVVEMPRGARFLSLQVQHERPQMWFLLDPEAEKVKRRFVISGTGHPVDQPELLTHLGSFQLFGGELVVHLFEYDAAAVR